MSSAFIFRNGTVVTQPFSTTLGELTTPRTPKRRSGQDAAGARQRLIEIAREEGFAEGKEEGFKAGQMAGYQAGFDQAYAEASNEQAEQLRAFAAELQRVHDNLEESIVEWFATVESDIEELSIQIAEMLVGAQLNLDRSFIIETTKAALQQITEANKARIRVNPFDSMILSGVREELLSATASLRGVEIVDDDTILGGCMIETDRGAIDATIKTRLELLEGGMEGAA